MGVEFTDSLMESFIEYLPQSDVLKVAKLNRKFKEIVERKLYGNIRIQKQPPLQIKQGWGSNTGNIATIISGSNINVKLTKLIKALKSDPNRLNYVQNITIVDKYGETTNSIFEELITLCYKGNGSIKLYIEDYKLRRQIKPIVPNESFFVQIDSLLELGQIANSSNKTKQIQLTFGAEKNDVSSIQEKLDQLGNIVTDTQLETFFNNLSSIEVNLNNDYANSIFWHLVNKVNDINFTMLEKLSFKYYHADTELNKDLFPMDIVLNAIQSIPWEQIVSLSMSLGCDDPNCNYECISDILDCISVGVKIQYLKVEQSSEDFGIQTHLTSSQWDLAVVGALINSTPMPNLKELTLKHKPPIDGSYQDGMEGNYLQRRNLYIEKLPKMINSRFLVNLNLDSLLAISSCYEQPMNNLLWNGCKCSHCETYLTILDEFLMTHKYFDSNSNCWKDLTTSQLFISIADALSHRIPSMGDFKYATQIEWDVHENYRYKYPFKCLDHKTIDEGEFEDPIFQDQEAFFDASEQFHNCDVNAKMFSDFCICLKHYTNDYLATMLNLNRGDAEGFEIGNENDGSGQQKFAKIQLNGFIYTVGKEVNGTNKFRCISD